MFERTADKAIAPAQRQRGVSPGTDDGERQHPDSRGGDLEHARLNLARVGSFRYLNRLGKPVLPVSSPLTPVKGSPASLTPLAKTVALPSSGCADPGPPRVSFDLSPRMT